MTPQRLNVAIVSPNKDVYSETFIQAHKKIDAKVYFYYGDYFPIYLEGVGKVCVEGSRYGWYLIKRRLGISSELTYKEQCLSKSFTKHGVQVVLAEYGPTGVSLLRICKKLNLRLIVHFHGFDASERVLLSKNSKNYREMFDYAEKIVVVSRKMFNDVSSLGCPVDKIVLNTYGPSDHFLASASFQKRKRQFVAVGRFVEKKAPHLTILAFRKLAQYDKDVKLLMVGNGVLLGVCKQMVKILNLEERVYFKGVLTPQQIKQVFDESIAFVQHSIVSDNGDSEGTPVAILEAAASGLPVIATKHAGIPEVVIHGVSGFLVDEMDIESMSDYMLKLLDHVELRNTMGVNARAHIMKNFTLQKHLQCLNDIINEVD